MLLIDATNIASGGGTTPLMHLTDSLHKKNLPYVVLIHPSLKRSEIKGELVETDPSPFKRKAILKKYIDKFKPQAVFYFGNYPPPFKHPAIKSIVFSQNLHLFKRFDNSAFSIKEKLNWKLKQLYNKRFLNNADYYVVPTSYVKDEFLHTFNFPESQMRIFPFYEEQMISSLKVKFEKEGIKKRKNNFIYVSSIATHKNHVNLFKAWDMVLDKGHQPILKLTIPKTAEPPPLFNKLLSNLKERGAEIININDKGFLPYEEILKETYTSEFTLFPSLNETYGFGQVEGALLGNKVLSSARAHVPPVLTASSTFNPDSPEDIAEKIIEAITTELPLPELFFRDKIEALITFLYSN